MKVEMSETTREALRNLFTILDIPGKTFDDRIFKLAEMAFMGRAEVLRDRQTLIKHAEQGAGRAPRKKIEIKLETANRLKELFHRMYPFLEWQSWDWWVQDMMDFVDEHMRDREAEEGLNKRREKE